VSQQGKQKQSEYDIRKLLTKRSFN